MTLVPRPGRSAMLHRRGAHAAPRGPRRSTRRPRQSPFHGRRELRAVVQRGTGPGPVQPYVLAGPHLGALRGASRAPQRRGQARARSGRTATVITPTSAACFQLTRGGSGKAGRIGGQGGVRGPCQAVPLAGPRGRPAHGPSPRLSAWPAAGRFGADYTLKDKDKNKPEEAEAVQDGMARSAST